MLNVIILIVVMLSVIMLNGNMLKAVMLSVVVPSPSIDPSNCLSFNLFVHPLVSLFTYLFVSQSVCPSTFKVYLKREREREREKEREIERERER
jgi:hypothetical protein